MKTLKLDVEGVPEPVVDAVKALVKALREHFSHQAQKDQRAPVELPTWPGKVIGSLTREEIYADRLDRVANPDHGTDKPEPQ